ncbi:MAG: hypothetical protein ABEJ55_04455 [Halanaeroarchaeum sp.]
MMRVFVLMVGVMLALTPLAAGVGMAAPATAGATDAAIAGPVSLPQADDSPTTTVPTNDTTTAQNGTDETTGATSATTATTTGDTAEGASETTDSETDSTLPPGAALAGVLGAQSAEHQSAVEVRTLGVQLNRTASNASEAGVIDAQMERIRSRLAALQNRSDRLERRYEAGNVSFGEYVARSTTLAAQIHGLERLINRTKAGARSLPQQALESRGVSMQSFDRMDNRTEALKRSNASSVARRVAGPFLGNPLGPTDPGIHPGNWTPGPGADRGQGAGTDSGREPGAEDGHGPPTERANDSSPHTGVRSPDERRDQSASNEGGPGLNPVNSSDTAQSTDRTPAENGVNRTDSPNAVDRGNQSEERFGPSMSPSNGGRGIPGRDPAINRTVIEPDGRTVSTQHDGGPHNRSSSV